MTDNSFNEKNVKKILKMLGRFDKLNGREITDLTNLPPEEINEIISYFRNLGVINIKGNNPPYNFKEISITKDGRRLYNKKLLDGQFET